MITSVPAAAAPAALQASLWIAQVILFLAFGAAGYLKVARPITALARTMSWVADAPPALVRFVGVSELAGAVGVLVPAATRIEPWLTPLAAVGLLLVMLLAIPVHVKKGELAQMGAPILLGLLAAFVAWGRFFVAPLG